MCGDREFTGVLFAFQLRVITDRTHIRSTGRLSVIVANVWVCVKSRQNCVAVKIAIGMLGDFDSVCAATRPARNSITTVQNESAFLVSSSKPRLRIEPSLPKSCRHDLILQKCID